MKMVNWLFTQSHGGTEVGRPRRDHRFLRAFVPLCETKTATVLFINYLYITCCDIIYPLCCYSVEINNNESTL